MYLTSTDKIVSKVLLLRSSTPRQELHRHIYSPLHGFSGTRKQYYDLHNALGPCNLMPPVLPQQTSSTSPPSPSLGPKSPLNVLPNISSKIWKQIPASAGSYRPLLSSSRMKACCAHAS